MKLRRHASWRSPTRRRDAATYLAEKFIGMRWRREAEHGPMIRAVEGGPSGNKRSLVCTSILSLSVRLSGNDFNKRLRQ